MPIYEYGGQQYDISTDDPTEAKNKILAHLNKASGTDNKTGFFDNLKIGLATAAGTVNQAVGGGIGGAIAVPEQLLTGDVKTATAVTDWGSKSKEDLAKWANPEEKEQSFGGKVVGMVGTLPAQLLAMPFTPVDSALEAQKRGESVDRSTLIGMEEAAGVIAGLKLPMTIGGTAAKKVLTGFGAGAAQDYATRQAQVDTAEQKATKEYFAPSLETAALAGIPGAALGGASHAFKVDTSSSPKPKEGIPDGVEDVPANRGSKEIYESSKLNAEKEIARSEYLIGKIEQDLKEKTFETLAEAEQYKKAKLEEVQNIQKDIMAHEETLRNAEALLRGEEPVLPKQTDMPSSLPPRPEGDFVRPEETPTGQDVNGNMFDTVDRTQDMLPEPSRIDSTAIKEEIGTEVSTRVNESIEPTFLERQLESTQDAIAKLEAERQIALQNENTRGVANEMESANGGTDYLDRPYNERSTIDIDKRLHQLRIIEERLLKEVGQETIEITAPKETGTIADIEADVPAGPRIHGGSDFIRGVMQDWIKKLGLDKEDTDIHFDMSFSEKGERGKFTVTGENSSVVKVAGLEQFMKAASKQMKSAKSALNMAQYKELWFAGHEIGHLLLTKVIQQSLFLNKTGSMTIKDTGLDLLIKEYDVWVQKIGVDAARKAGDLHTKPTDPDYYLKFPEFFSQRVARELLHGNSSRTGPVHSFVKQARQFLSDLLEHYGLKKAMSKNLVDDFIQNIIKENKQTLEDFGKTVWEISSTKTSLKDAAYWQAERFYPEKLKENQKTSFNAIDSGIKTALKQIESADSVLEQQRYVPDINPAGVGTIGRMVSGAMLKGSNWIFGIQQKAQLFKNSPLVKYSSDVILNAIHTQTSRSMELLTGAPSRAAWNGKRQKSHMISLQKVIDGDSPTVVFDKSSNEDFHAVHQLLEQGIGKYSYEETLSKLGGDLTPQQRLLYETATKMYAKMYKMAEESAQRLGKKSMIPNMKGWYPAMRKGEFTVNFRVKGLNRVAGRDDLGRAIMTDLVHSQSFRTKGEAQAFLDHFEKQSPEFKGRLEHDGIQQYKDADMPNNMSDFMEAYKQQRDKLMADLANPNKPKWLHDEWVAAGRDDLNMLDARMQRMTDMYIARGGTLGAHHRLRTNVSGAMGSEMFATTHDAGKAFRDANFKSVDEYTSLMMKMEIEEKLNLVLDKPDFRESHPNTLEVVTLMRDYALNKVESPMQMKGFKAAVDAVWEAAWDKGIAKPLGFIGAKKYHDAPTIDLALGKFSHFFYIHALMSRPAFWAAQGVQFLWAGRTMVKDNVGPVGAMTAAGKGMWSVLHPDKAFLEALFEVSQTSHTFSPQFINDLNKFGLTDFMKTGGKGKLVLDLITGEKMATAADTFSRLMTFGMMYEHFKAKGLEGSDLAQAAARATDENMVQYGRQYKAPVFQKMGVVGDLTSPLQTFSQAALGNIISDFSDIVSAPGGRAKLKASLPFMATMAITSLMAGVIGAPLVAEYEALRLLFNATWRKLDGESDLLPSVVDLVLQGDNDFSHRVLSHGLIGASTMPATDGQGLDIAASNRWQPLWGGIFTGEKTFMESIPVINFMLDRLDDTTAILKDASGITKMTQAESRTHRLGIVPGMYKGLVDDLLFNAQDREFVPTNKGQAFVPQTDTERAAKYLGTSTITSSTARLRERRTREQEMRDQVIIDKQIELMTDDVLKGDMDSVRERAMKLAQDYQMESDQIERRIESSIFKRKVPSGVRQFVGKGGTSSTQQQKRYNYVEETYGEPQQLNYEDQ